jgi:hypothetical protein
MRSEPASGSLKTYGLAWPAAGIQYSCRELLRCIGGLALFQSRSTCYSPPSFPMTCRMPTSLAATSSSRVLYKVYIMIGVFGNLS